MAAWEVVPCLLSLRAEFNSFSPNRDKASDGTIGDSNHSSSSDHTPDEDSRILRDHDGDAKNEVHALDIDMSGPWPGGQTFHQIVMRILDGERAKWRNPNDRCRLNYVIWNGKIYDKDNDFQPRDYKGANPHDKHAHFSARYETACENDTRPFGVKPPVVQPPVSQEEPLDAETKAYLDEKFAALVRLTPFTSGGGSGSPIGNAVLGHGYPSEFGGQRASMWENLRALQTDVNAMQSQLNEIQAMLTSIFNGGSVPPPPQTTQ